MTIFLQRENQLQILLNWLSIIYVSTIFVSIYKSKIKIATITAKRYFRRIDMHIRSFAARIFPRLITPALLELARMKAVKRIITKSSIPPRDTQRRRQPPSRRPIRASLADVTSFSGCFYTNPAPDDIKPCN